MEDFSSRKKLGCHIIRRLLHCFQGYICCFSTFVSSGLKSQISLTIEETKGTIMEKETVIYFYSFVEVRDRAKFGIYGKKKVSFDLTGMSATLTRTVTRYF